MVERFRRRYGSSVRLRNAWRALRGIGSSCAPMTGTVRRGQSSTRFSASQLAARCRRAKQAPGFSTNRHATPLFKMNLTAHLGSSPRASTFPRGVGRATENRAPSLPLHRQLWLAMPMTAPSVKESLPRPPSSISRKVPSRKPLCFRHKRPTVPRWSGCWCWLPGRTKTSQSTSSTGHSKEKGQPGGCPL